MNFHELHQRALEAARKYFQAEAELLDLIQKIDACKGFRNLGHTSLFSCAAGELKLSESTALNLINVARKAVQVPALKTEIQNGRLSVCRARKIVPVLNVENQAEWIEKAKTLPTRKLEKEIARVAPGEAFAERVRYVTESRVNLSLSLDEKTLATMKRVQDLESQRTGRAVSLEETMAAMAAAYIERNDPVERAKRVSARMGKAATKASRAPVMVQTKAPEKTRPKYADVTRHMNSVKTQGYRRTIPASVEHQVTLRDGARCTAVDHRGTPCENGRWTHIHHLKPVSQGGANTLENLTTLCSAHHRMEHEGNIYGPMSPALTKLIFRLDEEGAS